MDIYTETKQPLMNVWENKLDRQYSKFVILKAIANVTDITAKQADDIFQELDNLLLEEEKDEKRVGSQGL